MIGKGAQYLKAAGFGRYRITAASLGSLDLLGTIVFRDYLTAATKQAIMAAFGVDGTAVIAATNEYLNGIAASDMAKATALAGWLNTYAIEDPKIVYSLVEGIGYRYCESSGGAYIQTNIIGTADLIFESEFAFLTGGQYPAIFGAASANEAQRYTIHGNNGATNVGFRLSLFSANYATTAGAWNRAKISKEEVSCNGTILGSFSGTLTTPKMTLFAENQNGNIETIRRANARVKWYKFSRSQSAWFIPFIHDDNGTKINGMLDLIGGTFYANAGSGSFTISETPTP